MTFIALLHMTKTLCFSMIFSLFSHAAKRKMWKLKSFGSLRNVSKTGNINQLRCIFQILIDPPYMPGCHIRSQASNLTY